MQDDKNITTDSSTIHRIDYKGKELIIIATAHVSKESQEEVKRIIEAEQPNSVCIELDENRYKSIVEKDKYSKLDIIQVIKQGKAMLIMANLFLSSFQRKIAAKMDIQPGAEMIQGIESAKEIGAELVLADRDIQTTFRRIWRKSTAGEKFKLLYQILGSLLISEKDLEVDDIEKMKTEDMLDSALSMMGETFPLIKEVLIDERDVYLANKIKKAPGDKIVAVLGAGHVPGVKRLITEQEYSVPNEVPVDRFEKKVVRRMPEDKIKYLKEHYKKEENSDYNYTLTKDISEDDKKKLSGYLKTTEKEIPKKIPIPKFEKKILKKLEPEEKKELKQYYKKSNYELQGSITTEEEQKLLHILYSNIPNKGIAGKIIAWAVPVLIIVWIVSGFIFGGFKGGIMNFLSYALGTGIGAGLGSIVSLAHPITILVGILAAPITVLHPILGVGWFTGLSEAYLRKPRVSDLEKLGKDIQSVKGFFKNRFTHILVVILFSSLGTMLGIFVGIPIFNNMLNIKDIVETPQIVEQIKNDEQVYYKDTTIKGDLYFVTSASDELSVKAPDDKELIILDINIQGEIVFENCHFEGVVSTTNFPNNEGKIMTEFNDIKFDNCIFEKEVNFSYTEFLGDAVFTNSKFKDNTSFESAKFVNTADFSRVIFDKEATFHNVKFSNETTFKNAIKGGEPFNPAEEE